MNIYYKYYEYMIVLSNCVLLLSVYQKKNSENKITY